MVSDGTTTCSTRVRSPKEKKIWREVAEYLWSRVDRTRILRCEGPIIICDLEALKQEEGKSDGGQRQQHEIIVGYCSCGAAYPLQFCVVETAVPGGNGKGQTKGASRII